MSSIEARERRQARLRAQGGDRLARITKTFHPELYEESKSTPEANMSSEENTTHSSSIQPGATQEERHDDDPPISIIDGYSNRGPNSAVSAPSSNGGSNEMPFINDPLFQMLNEMKQSSSGNGDDTAWPFEDPFEAMSSFAALANGSGTGAFSNSMPSKQVTADLKLKEITWNLLHLLLCVFIAFSSTGLVLKLCTGEIILHTTRFIADKGQIPNSMIANIASYIGEPYGSYLRMSTRYLGIGQTVLGDVCVILFMYILLHGQVA